MMKKLRSALLTATVLSLAFAACNKDEDKYDGNATLAFYPLELGHYVTYQVDSVIWDDFQCLRTVHKMQHRYQVADTFTDNQGRPSYRIDILTRPADSLQWSVDEVIYATRTPDHLELVQNNLRFIRLAFPISNGKTWLGNSMIPSADQDYAYLSGWNYKYTNQGQDYNNGLSAFQNTVTVEQVDEQQNDPESMPTAYAYKTYGKEVYAYGVGLVFREATHWIYDPGASNPCRKGYSVILRAIDHN